MALYVDHNLRSTYEAFLLVQGLPASGAVRFGQFVPAYGWRFEDHKSYVREKLGFNPANRGATIIPDQGVEFGLHPMSWDFTAALTNGAAGVFDRNEGKTVSARAVLRRSLGEVNICVGGSYRYSDLGLKSPLSRYAGAFWAGNLQRLTYMGEADWLVTDRSGLAATHLLSLRLRRGLTLSAQYDYYDPDLDAASGWEQRGRLSSELYVTGYLVLIPAVELNRREAGGVTENYGSVELQFHFWY